MGIQPIKIRDLFAFNQGFTLSWYNKNYGELISMNEFVDWGFSEKLNKINGEQQMLCPWSIEYYGNHNPREFT